MSDKNTSWKSAAEKWLQSLGYPYACLQTPMDSQIDQWEHYYRTTGDFYERKERDDKGHPVDVKVRSLTPAKMVCEDMSSVVWNETSNVSIPGDNDLKIASTWLEGWLKETAFSDKVPLLIQRMCAVGTGAHALRLKNVQIVGKSRRLQVSVQRYDAQHFIPLDWDGEECTAAAFVADVYIKGQQLTQIEVHRPGDNGDYELMVRLFDKEGKSVLPDGYTDGVIRTKQKGCTFEIYKLALDNTYWESSPFGVSLFDEATDAIETVDLAFDNIGNDIFLGKKMVMLPASMLTTNDDGKSQAPQLSGKQFFVVLEGKTVYQDGAAPKVVEYNPDLRADENAKMLSIALSVLGKRIGFGPKYYSLDDAGAVKTAKEVASDNSEMMRTVRRHEHMIRPGIERLIATAASIYSTIGGMAMPSDMQGAVQVVMGDSIMQDDDSIRERDRADLAIGALELWRYMVRHQGYTEEEAKAYVASQSLGTNSALSGIMYQRIEETMAKYESGEITEGRAINLIAQAMNVDKSTAKKILDGDISDLDIPEEA